MPLRLQKRYTKTADLTEANAREKELKFLLGYEPSFGDFNSLNHPRLRAHIYLKLQMPIGPANALQVLEN